MDVQVAVHFRIRNISGDVQIMFWQNLVHFKIEFGEVSHTDYKKNTFPCKLYSMEFYSILSYKLASLCIKVTWNFECFWHGFKFIENVGIRVFGVYT
jgi:hypothetical protein